MMHSVFVEYVGLPRWSKTRRASGIPRPIYVSTLASAPDDSVSELVAGRVVLDCPQLTKTTAEPPGSACC